MSYWVITACVTIFLVLGAGLFLHQSYRKQEELRGKLKKTRREISDIAQFLIHNPHPFIQLSQEGRVIFANPAAGAAYPGLSEDGLEHPMLAGLENLLGADSKKEISREITFNDKTWSQSVSVLNASGHKALAIYCYDVTQRKQFEGQLEESRRQAEAANQAKSDFLANMSHELRTPMNAIIGLSNILSRMDINPKAKELAGVVNSSSHNLLTLLNDILDFSKIEAGELTLENIPFDLHQMVSQTIILQTPVAASKGLALKNAVDADIPPSLMGDPVRIQQIINNLVNNALKFTHKGFVEIAVKLHDDKNQIRISVKDTGIGIAENKQEEVFKKFTQADVSTSRKYGGTGLGLSITRQLTELMGGEISLESKEGVGTTFHVTIPLPIVQEDAKIPEKTASPLASMHIDEKILIVDDHPINLLFMRNALQELGCMRVDEAKSGQEALQLFAETDYKLVLMDCQMPGMDGFETSRRIRMLGKDANPAIIAVTADAMKGAREKCIAASMDDYISKPVDIDKLRTTLDKWLTRKTLNVKGIPGIKTPAHDHVLFDWQHLDAFTGGDALKEREIIELFSQCTKEGIELLEESIRSGNHDEWERQAHKLCGSAMHFGAQTLAEACSQAEALGAERQKEKEKMLEEISLLYGQLDKFLQSRQHVA
jgi:signal transduction histidine kinase/CheY-like chemotaxis protein/HPt (histidine-containing phosphotransfer) domain-containing protein